MLTSLTINSSSFGAFHAHVAQPQDSDKLLYQRAILLRRMRANKLAALTTICMLFIVGLYALSI